MFIGFVFSSNAEVSEGTVIVGEDRDKVKSIIETQVAEGNLVDDRGEWAYDWGDGNSVEETYWPADAENKDYGFFHWGRIMEVEENTPTFFTEYS